MSKLRLLAAIGLAVGILVVQCTIADHDGNPQRDRALESTTSLAPLAVWRFYREEKPWFGN
jgi:hypothetical protein